MGLGARLCRHALGTALCGLLLAAGGIAAAEQAKLALTGGRLIDGHGGPPIANSVILIEGERIKAIGTVENLPVPAGYKTLSTEGMSVLPGLWDMHVHLMINGHADYEHWDRTYPARFEKEIMPASAHQLLMAGVTSARDLGGPLEASIKVRDAVAAGKIPGPTLYVSGPFIQHEPYPGTELFRWGVTGVDDARGKVTKLADAGVNVIKMVDQDQMTMEEVQAVVSTAHARGLPVVAHSHRPEEIRRGLVAGADCFEHTGLATAPEYPDDVITLLRARTADMSRGPLYWTPTIEGLFNYESLLLNPEQLDDPAWLLDMPRDIVDDIRKSIAHPDRLSYFRITPQRRPTLARKFQQLRESGVVLLTGTDSGIPMKFHSSSTWRELDAWVSLLGVDSMTAIRAATIWPATAMKVDKDSGSIAEGKYADIIAVRGDVLRYINLLQDVDLVVRHGRVHKRPD
ncbi:MAG: amidohydrolase family protein [Candidatus Polarisedimenticolia bacterium]